MTRQTAPGGSSNLSGAIYQILWCLLRAVKIRVGAFQIEVGQSTENAPFPILVLEPLGGGGDVRIIGGDFEVEQIKTKADEGTWSLQSVISEVLPDLFLATNAAEAKPCIYRFVTEGRIGRWSDVRGFFKKLSHRPMPPDVVSGLDDTRPLRFQRQSVSIAAHRAETLFFHRSDYTEKTLFLRIVGELQRRSAIQQLLLTEVELHRRLWTLLAHFDFVESKTTEAISREIDSLLLTIVDHQEDIPDVRRTLAMSLMEKASQGSFELVTNDFLAEHDLRATPLTKWASIRDQAAQELKASFEEVGYDCALDVRRELSESIFRLWASSGKVLIVTGESGQGKTWRMAAIASSASEDVTPVVWVEGKRDADRDLQAAADRFWLDIRGGADLPIPLRQVANRLQETVGQLRPHRLRVFIDGVVDYQEALGIIREDWSSRGIQIALACSIPVAESLRADHADRVFVQACKDFSWEELHNFLQSRLGPEWASVPDHVREILRRPLLAGIYCDDLFEQAWVPTNEYELYQAVWKRLSIGPQINFPLDVTQIESLALDVVSGSPYPWTAEQIAGHQIDNACLGRLERSGWLVRTTDSCFRVFHNRLLNWAVAQSLFLAIRRGISTVGQIVSQVADISRRGGDLRFADLGFVPLDVLWLASEQSELSESFVKDILTALEPTFRNRSNVLYSEILPALGPRIAVGLLAHIRDFDGPPWVLNAMEDALAATVGERITEFAGSLLNDVSPKLQRRGLKLARRVACPALLDRIWQLHVAAIANAAPFLGDHEHESTLREDSFGALKKAAANQTAWIVRTLARASSVEPIHDLGWLVENQSDGGSTWRQCKALLFSNVSSSKPRVLAANIGKYRDTEEVSWLKANLSNRVDLCGPMALKALGRIDPDAAVSCLDHLDLFERYLTRRWCFDEIRYRRPDAVAAKILSCVLQTDDPWNIALAFSEREDAITPAILNELLDDLTDRLNTLLLVKCSDNFDRYYRELHFLAGIHAPHLIEAIQLRRGQPFEVLLAKLLLRIGPRPGLDRNSLSRKPGIALLRTIGGVGFCDVIEDALQSAHRYGRLDALEWSPRISTDSTLRLIEKVVGQSETWDNNFPLEQREAMKALAIHSQWQSVGDGLVRWALKTSPELVERRLVPSDYSADWVDDLRTTVELDPTSGNVAAIAFAGSSSDAAILHRLLTNCDPTSELAHACVIGLELLNDRSDDGVRMVASHLLNDLHRYSATRMLSNAGTPLAWDALLSDLRRRFDHVTALNLINLTSHEREVVQLATEALPSHRGLDFWDLLYALVRNIRKPQFKAELLADPWLRDALHRAAVEAEGSFWIEGSKEAAIGCLMEIDPNAAFQAATRALLCEDSHDRARYPYLLIEIDACQAIPVLIGSLSRIRSPHVRVAIGRALGNRQDLATHLRECYDDPSKQEVACFLTGFSDDAEVFRNCLVSALDDDNDRVVRAAMRSLDRMANRQVCRGLLERAANAASLVDKWLYLDHFVEAVDPGDEDRFNWPSEAICVLEDISPLIRSYLTKRLNERRKRVNEEMRKHEDEN